MYCRHKTFYIVDVKHSMLWISHKSPLYAFYVSYNWKINIFNDPTIMFDKKYKNNYTVNAYQRNPKKFFNIYTKVHFLALSLGNKFIEILDVMKSYPILKNTCTWEYFFSITHSLPIPMCPGKCNFYTSNRHPQRLPTLNFYAFRVAIHSYFIQHIYFQI